MTSTQELTQDAEAVEQFDAIVIGAGVTGLYALYRLRQLGLSARSFEEGSGVGGPPQVDGRQALEFIREEPFDLVLLDIMLPVMNGYEVLEELRADQALCQIPVIITTALDESDGKAKCLELGAEDYLTKPFNPVLLKSRLGDCLERHRRG